MSLDWGYNENNGPDKWAEKYPLAAGKRQSPVDINTMIVRSDTSLVETPLTWRYPSDRCYRMVNTGYGWRVDTLGEHTELKGGPLNGVYKLEQFHCHWGPNSSTGSEHTVDGKTYAGELHLVHWNCVKYNSFQEAATQPDGLAVLGVFLQVNHKDNEELEKLVCKISDIIHKGQSTTIDFDIKCSDLIPGNAHYWTYLGSLTTPPCNESVIWILFKDPIEVSERQLSAFRSLKNVEPDVAKNVVLKEESQLVKNYRPPLPLGNRVLRECGSV